MTNVRRRPAPRMAPRPRIEPLCTGERMTRPSTDARRSPRRWFSPARLRRAAGTGCVAALVALPGCAGVGGGIAGGAGPDLSGRRPAGGAHRARAADLLPGGRGERRAAAARRRRPADRLGHGQGGDLGSAAGRRRQAGAGAQRDPPHRRPPRERHRDRLPDRRADQPGLRPQPVRPGDQPDRRAVRQPRGGRRRWRTSTPTSPAACCSTAARRWATTRTSPARRRPDRRRDRPGRRGPAPGPALRRAAAPAGPAWASAP